MLLQSWWISCQLYGSDGIPMLYRCSTSCFYRRKEQRTNVWPLHRPSTFISQQYNLKHVLHSRVPILTQCKRESALRVATLLPKYLPEPPDSSFSVRKWQSDKVLARILWSLGHLCIYWNNWRLYLNYYKKCYTLIYSLTSLSLDSTTATKPKPPLPPQHIGP